MADGNILSDFGIDLLEEEIDDVIFQTNEFLTDATFTGSQGPFWYILQISMGLGGLFAIIMCANMAYKMMIKKESDYPFMHLLYSQLLVCQRVCLQNTVCLICK